VITGVVSVPCRYIHSPCCLVALEDIMHTATLVENLARAAREIYNKTIGV
jgi:putative aminopeptidase FrvX